MVKQFTRRKRNRNRRYRTIHKRRIRRQNGGSGKGRRRRNNKTLRQRNKEKAWINALGIHIDSNEKTYNQVYDNIESLNINSLPEFIHLFDDLPIQSSDCLLDVGSGLGLMCFLIKQKCDFGKVYGIEQNKKLYNASKKNLTLLGIEGVKFLNKDIFSVPSPIPACVTYLYLFNPFHYELVKFKQFCGIVKKFCQKHNKMVTVIWINSAFGYKPLEHENILNEFHATVIKQGVVVYPYRIFTIGSTNLI